MFWLANQREPQRSVLLKANGVTEPLRRVQLVRGNKEKGTRVTTMNLFSERKKPNRRKNMNGARGAHCENEQTARSEKEDGGGPKIQRTLEGVA